MKSNLLAFAVVFDLTKDWEPIGVWATDKKLMEVGYVDGYELEAQRYEEAFEDLKVSSWNGFWEYWIAQGGNEFSIVGPFEVASEVGCIEFITDATKDIGKFVEGLKRKGVKARALTPVV